MRKSYLFFACLLMFGCIGNNYDRSLILENVADNLILPAYQDFALEVDTLQTKATAFTENPTEETLSEARSAWKDAILSWKHAEVYNFGPIEKQFLVSSIDRWPTSEGGIETAIAEFEGSENYLLRIGSNRKGLPAIEYLLFNSSDDDIINAFAQNNRKAYLHVLIAKLVEHSAAVIEEWENTYRHKFIVDEGNTTMSGITLLANEMGYVLGTIRHEKLGIPFGEQTGGNLRLHMMESQHANISKALIRETLTGVQNAFNGGEGAGFDDYLRELNIEHEEGRLLSEAINDEFANIYSVLEKMDGTLRENMETNPKQVQKLIQKVQNVYVLVNVDMISQLGIISVFSDNDGD